MEILQIDHMTFVVKHLDKSREFYRDRLGLKEVSRPNFDFPGLWYQAGATLLHLIEEHDRTGPAGINNLQQEKTSRHPHLAFAVDDAEDAATNLLAAGVPFLTPLKRRPDGALQVFVLDPDDHIIELTSAPIPSKSHSRGAIQSESPA